MSESLDTQLYQALLGDPTLAGLVGSNIFRLRLPPAFFTTPGQQAVTYQRISTTPLYVHSFTTGQQASVGTARYQLTIWTQSQTAADALDQIVLAILAILNQFNAWALPASPEVVTQAPSFLLNRTDGSDGQTDPPTDWTRLDVRLWYQNQ